MKNEKDEIVGVDTEYMSVETGTVTIPGKEKDCVILYVRYKEIDSIEPLIFDPKDFKKMIKDSIALIKEQ